MLRVTLMGVLLAGIVATSTVAQEEKGKPHDALITTPGDHTVSAENLVLIGVPNSSALEKMVTELKVTIDGKAEKAVEPALHGMIGGGYSCFVYKPTKAGKYKIEITPHHGPNKTAGKKATFNVTVK